MKTTKTMNNLDIAELLRDIAAAYEIKNTKANKFRIVAYERAADAVEHLSSEVKDLWDEGKLENVAGIGESIAGHLGKIFNTGTSKHFDEVMEDLSPAIFEMMKVSGIGPKTAHRISKQFKNKFQPETGRPLEDKDEFFQKKNPIDVLEKLAKDGEIEKLEGFGKESQEAILKSIKDFKNKPAKRMLLPYALEISERLIKYLQNDSVKKIITKVEVLGSLRRKVSTVGDIDLVVSTTEAEKVISYFCKYPNKSRVIEQGKKEASILLPNGVRVDLKTTPPGEWGSMLQHFTGSKQHNIALREYAKSLNPSLSLSEYGIREIQNTKSVKRKFSSEKDFYKYLGMEWIPPELREDMGEIEASQINKLPSLIKMSDIKGDLHTHSDFDIETSHDLGQSNMWAMVDRADQLGYEYMAFSEHNPSHSKHSEQQILRILKAKSKKIEDINSKLMMSKNNRVQKVFNSLEIDILPDGNLPVSNEGLQSLDFALVSIHSSFRQSKTKMTKRVLSALSQQKVKIFAHPTARKLNERESIELDWEKIFDFCLKHDKWLEINTSPSRLDLPDFLVRDAVKLGVKLTLGTDSHHTNHMDNMPWGVSVARRGWAEKKDIVNTSSLRGFEKLLDL